MSARINLRSDRNLRSRNEIAVVVDLPSPQRWLVAPVAASGRLDHPGITVTGVVLDGAIATADVEHWSGLPVPSTPWVGLRAPEPIDGQDDGWIMVDDFSFWTSDLLAARIVDHA